MNVVSGVDRTPRWEPYPPHASSSGTAMARRGLGGLGESCRVRKTEREQYPKALTSPERAHLQSNARYGNVARGVS